MGLLDNQTSEDYYASGNSANYGGYQFVTLDHVINGFMVSYVGEGKIIGRASRTDVQFHAMRALQELSYDTLRSHKALEIEVPNTLQMILPQDYINYSKITMVTTNGVEKILYPTSRTSNPLAPQQDADGVYVFDTSGTATDEALLTEDSTTWANFSTAATTTDSTSLTSSLGGRYGLDPQSAQDNGSFYIDNDRGLIHFGASLAGGTIILHYVSDGLGTDAEMLVHKFCEEAMYKCVAYGVVAAKSNMPEYIVQRFKKERFAEVRKAKIRLSNIKIEEFAQILKNMGKPIK
jgi:hypothetical protein